MRAAEKGGWKNSSKKPREPILYTDFIGMCARGCSLMGPVTYNWLVAQSNRTQTECIKNSACLYLYLPRENVRIHSSGKVRYSSGILSEDHILLHWKFVHLFLKSLIFSFRSLLFTLPQNKFVRMHVGTAPHIFPWKLIYWYLHIKCALAARFSSTRRWTHPLKKCSFYDYFTRQNETTNVIVTKLW